MYQKKKQPNSKLNRSYYYILPLKSNSIKQSILYLCMKFFFVKFVNIRFVFRLEIVY